MNNWNDTHLQFEFTNEERTKTTQHKLDINKWESNRTPIDGIHKIEILVDKEDS